VPVLSLEVSLSRNYCNVTGTDQTIVEGIGSAVGATGVILGDSVSGLEGIVAA
jgi:hypothetical protein